ncbi:MAG: hypothetical protein APF76_05310 [Desulfitibacter sp. BRH_c19]|nr:MAG: hypothetical protein APF76_05310 [Desulfitibacter sp. BRH_c19]
MAFDGITMNAINQELQQKISEARIDKIYQPNPGEIVLHLRKYRESFKLLVSAHPVYARICITKKTFDNPKSPPLFCMVLRKHLEGGKILSIEQLSFDRVLKISIENHTEIGEIAQKTLIIEIMGKHSNLILLNEHENKIIDSIKKVSYGTSQYRQVLPGVEYISPPYQDKLNILEISQEQFSTKLLAQEMTLPMEKALLNTIMGLSPILATQLAAKVNLKGTILEYCGDYELNLIWQSVIYLKDTIQTNSYMPIILLDKNEQYRGFSPINVPEYHNEQVLHLKSINETVDEYYDWLLKNSHFVSKKSNLQNSISKEIKRCEKKLGIQLLTVQESKNSQQDKIFGELLTANMHLVKRGMDEIQVADYYHDNTPVTIKLRSELSPAENSQRYFKRYNKAKNAAKKAAVQAQHSREELDYLESLDFWLSETNSHGDFAQIEQELNESGYLKLKNKLDKKDKAKPIPNTFITTEGYKILVGKNNKQNDWLTFKVAKDGDLWFHAKDIPGSHVILKLEGGGITDDIIKKAALLAAYHSKGKYSANLPVAYTQIKNVKKIKGAKPGLVTYENYKTVYVTPDKDLIDKLFVS